jgi:PadR family transcriptional regulator PadR
MVTQLKKGILEMCILYQIKDELLYGYEIMKSVRQVFPDVYEGSVYAILRRLHANGLADVIQRVSSGGPPRKYYVITESGREYLSRIIEEWRAILQGVSSLGIR